MTGVDALVEATTRWYLTWEPDGDIEETIAAGRDGFERLGRGARRRSAPRSAGAAASRSAERLVGAGVPEALARAHALRPEQRFAPDMVSVAGATGIPIEQVAEVFFAVGTELRLDWIEGELDRVPASTRMQRWALAGGPRGRGAGAPRARRVACSPSPRVAGPRPRWSRRT